MGRRYSDIKRGGELKTALDNKTAWDLNTNGARKTKRLTGGTGTKRNLKTVSVIPFTTDGDLTPPTRYLVRMTAKSFDTSTGTAFAKTKADNYYDTTPDASAVKPPSGFRPARMSTFQTTGTGTTINYVQSKVTKLYYPQRLGDAYHYPIGRAKASPQTGDERSTKAALLADLVTELNAVAGRSVTFSDEKMGGNA